MMSHMHFLCLGSSLDSMWHIECQQGKKRQSNSGKHCLEILDFGNALQSYLELVM